jgi:hypothetical protein
MSLYFSTKSTTRPNHKHIIYVRQIEDGSFKVVVSEASGHTHQGTVSEDGILEILPAGKGIAHTSDG